MSCLTWCPPQQGEMPTWVKYHKQLVVCFMTLYVTASDICDPLRIDTREVCAYWEA